MPSLLSDSSILPEELATQSVRLKEEQLRREEEKVPWSIRWTRGSTFDLIFVRLQLREIELKVQREISEKRQELLAKEQSLRYVSVGTVLHAVLTFDWYNRNLESRLAAHGSLRDL
jgi:hypothetical protein